MPNVNDAYITEESWHEFDDMLHRIDKKVAIIEEHLRTQNGAIVKVIADCDNNKSFNNKVTGALIFLGAMIPVVSGLIFFIARGG